MSEYREVFVKANGVHCDFCKVPPIGWTRVPIPDRFLGGIKQKQVFMVCAEHIKLGTPVYPVEEAK